MKKFSQPAGIAQPNNTPRGKSTSRNSNWEAGEPNRFSTGQDDVSLMHVPGSKEMEPRSSPDAVGRKTMRSIFMTSALVGAALAFSASAFAADDWDLNHREQWLQERVDRGLQDGSLSSDEAKHVRHDL
jgi:hypothetical protein